MQLLYHLFSPPKFYQLTGKVLPILGTLCICSAIYGLYAGLYLAPADYLQGDGFRIMYVHVPSAFLSLLAYGILVAASLLTIIFQVTIADYIAQHSAKLGAFFTALALVTGAIWGKPMWGTWWLWGDPRLTAELILLLQYIAYLALRNAMPRTKSAQSSYAMIAVLGGINIPIVHFSVTWWHSLHQGASLARLGLPTIALPMLLPLLAMIASFILYYVVILMWRVRADIVYKLPNLP